MELELTGERIELHHHPIGERLRGRYLQTQGHVGCQDRRVTDDHHQLCIRVEHLHKTLHDVMEQLTGRARTLALTQEPTAQPVDGLDRGLTQRLPEHPVVEQVRGLGVCRDHGNAPHTASSPGGFECNLDHERRRAFALHQQNRRHHLAPIFVMVSTHKHALYYLQASTNNLTRQYKKRTYRLVFYLFF